MQVRAHQRYFAFQNQLWSGLRLAPWEAELANHAALYVDNLLWLMLQRLPSLAQEDLVSLAEIGNLDVLKRLRTDPSVPLEWWTRDLCLAAASTGDLAMLQWLRALEPPVP